jgi:hypothetical protein
MRALRAFPGLKSETRGTRIGSGIESCCTRIRRMVERQRFCR